MDTNASWGPTKTWSYQGPLRHYSLEYYGRKRHPDMRRRWAFFISGTGSGGRTPIDAVINARRHYLAPRRPT